MRKEISIKNVNCIRIEKREEFKNSPFSEQYNSMDRIVSGILEQQEDSGRKQDVADKFANENYVHNIVAVVGERGMGKSSAMLSYAFFLKEYCNKQYEDIPKALCDREYCVLDKVDANMMHGKEYLFDIVLAKMWDAFHEKFMAKLPQDQEGKELQASFGKVKKSYIDFKGVSDGKNAMKEYAPLQQLHDLSASMNLRGDFAKLTKSYLNYMGECEGKQRYLVVCIDDIDLITNCAYERLEEIYSFFTIPNVLVFLSLDIQRMHMDLCKKFSDRLLWDSGAEVLKKKVSDYAEAYIAKVLPRNARVYMPYLGANLNNLIISNVGTVLEKVFYIKKIPDVSVNTFVRLFFLHKMNIMFHDEENILFSSKRSLRNIVNRVYELIDLLQLEGDNESISLWIKKELSVSVEQLQDDVRRSQVYEIMAIDSEDYNYYYANLDRKEYTTQKDASYQKVIAALYKEKKENHAERDYLRLLILLYSVELADHMQDSLSVFRKTYIKSDMINSMIPEKCRPGGEKDKIFSRSVNMHSEKKIADTLVKNAKLLVKVFHGLLIHDIDAIKVTVEQKDISRQVDLAGGTGNIGILESTEKAEGEKQLQVTVSGEEGCISIDNYFYNVFEYESKWRKFIEKLCEKEDLSSEQIQEIANTVAIRGDLKRDQYREWKETYQVHSLCDLIPLQNVDIMLMLEEHFEVAKFDNIRIYPLLVKQIIDIIVETFSMEERRQYSNDDAKVESCLGKKYLYSEKIKAIYQIAPFTSEEIQAYPVIDTEPNAED